MMRPIRSRAALAPVLSMGLALMAWAPAPANAYTFGWGGGGSGCGGCHGSEASQTLTVSITGSATLLPGQTGTYTLTIDPVNNGGAFSVAASSGTLGVVSPNTSLSGGAVTHSAANVGTWQYNFSLTAPGTIGAVVTLASTGMAFDGPNGNGPSDIWSNLGSGFTVNVIPEPATAALMGFGPGLLAMVGRRRG